MGWTSAAYPMLFADARRRGGDVHGRVSWLASTAQPFRDPFGLAELVDRHLRRWCRGLLSVCGVHLWRAGETPAGAERARLVVANHRSPFDIPILLSVFGGQFLSRADLTEWPVFGRAARRVGTIFRQSRRIARAVRRRFARNPARAARGSRHRLPRGHHARRGRGARVPRRRLCGGSWTRCGDCARRARLSAPSSNGSTRGFLDHASRVARRTAGGCWLLCRRSHRSARWHARAALKPRKARCRKLVPAARLVQRSQDVESFCLRSRTIAVPGQPNPALPLRRNYHRCLRNCFGLWLLLE